jgi:hypothetical protein
VLSPCGLPLPPTCLLVTVNEARSYFASTILRVPHAALILNSSKLSPVVDASKLLYFPNYCKVIRNENLRSLSEATSYHPNVFTFKLFLSQREGVAWETSNKVMFFLLPRKIKVLSLLPVFLFATTLHLAFLYLSRLQSGKDVSM